MKRMFIIVSFFIFKATCNSQTLTAANCNPVLGDEIDIYADNFVSPGAAGVAQFWDFSSLNKNPLNTCIMESPSVLAQPGEFSSCNLSCEKVEYIREFYQASTSGFNFYGSETSFAPPYIKTQYNNPEVLLAYPFSFNSTNIDTWSSTGAGITGTTSILCDGTGTLITKFGVYPNALRIRTLRTTSEASTKITEDYSWYTPGVHGPLLSLYTTTTVGFGIYSEARIYDMSKATSLRTAPNTNAFYSICTNPVCDELSLTLVGFVSQDYKVKIFDIHGQLILSEQPGNQVPYKINISHLSPGIYFFELTTKERESSCKKFLITR